LIADRHPYSYRDDRAVPDFSDERPIAFMDGTCLLCTIGARLIARLDHSGTIRICPIQTPLGRAILEHYGMDPEDPVSWLYLEDGTASSSLDGMIRIGRRVGGWGHLIRPLSILPRGLQDWLYIRLAENRYRLFGRAELCEVPDPALRARLML
jgi:predicted DCC family thiol-disulfide oxidoreductase YuxK